jgi:hypothetical protein
MPARQTVDQMPRARATAARPRALGAATERYSTGRRMPSVAPRAVPALGRRAAERAVRRPTQASSSKRRRVWDWRTQAQTTTRRAGIRTLPPAVGAQSSTAKADTERWRLSEEFLRRGQGDASDIPRKEASASRRSYGVTDGPNASTATATSRAVLRGGPTRPRAKLSADFGTRSDDEDRARRVVYDLCGGGAEQAIEPRVPV